MSKGNLLASSGKLALLLLMALVCFSAQAQVVPQDTIAPPQDTAVAAQEADTLVVVDTLALDVPISPSAMPDEVVYSARDSIITDLQNKKIYLYGAAQINYQDLQLNAERIVLDMDRNEIEAYGATDTAGNMVGLPVFRQGDQETEQRRIRYNFKTKKGRIDSVRIQQEDDYIIAERLKSIKQGDTADIIYARNAKYTTCDKPHPHFYLQATKMKLIVRDKVITGPAVMKIEDVPLPLGIPFGFFPQNSRKSAGIVPPAISEDNRWGFGFRNGGFYYGLNDYWDAAITGDFYTRGSYNMNFASKYRLRYRFGGDVMLSLGNFMFGDPQTPDFQRDRQFAFVWNHAQDAKANPSSTFSSSVNVRSSRQMRYASVNINDIGANTLNSSINYNKRFERTPFSLNVSATQSQNNSDGSMVFTLPSAQFYMNTIQPLKSPGAISDAWYHNISTSYNVQFQNQYNTFDSLIFRDLALQNMRYGFSQAVPVYVNFPVFRYFTLTPKVDANGVYFFSRNVQEYVERPDRRDTVITRREEGFFAAHGVGTSMSLNTRIFGRVDFRRGPVVAVRHILSPTFSLNYRPDARRMNPAAWLYYIDSAGRRVEYNAFQGAIFGTPGNREEGSLGISLNNIFSAKLRDRTDTAEGVKRINIFDQFNIGTFYNFLADSFHLADITLTATTQLTRNVNLNLGATFDPYIYDEESNRRRHETYMESFSGLGKMRTGTVAINTSLNPDALFSNAGRMVNTVQDPRVAYLYPLPYADFDVPWNLSMNYTLYYAEPRGAPISVQQFIQGSAEVNLTRNWKINVQSGYDLRQKELTPTQVTIVRDLHCWEMNFNWIPFGNFRSYYFSLYVKSTRLRDLKLNKQQPFYVQ